MSEPNHSVTVRLERLTHGGACIGVLDTAHANVARKKIFIRDTIPGEIVCARIISMQKNFEIAKLEKVLQPSPDRVIPPCPYFGACGGCDLQHMSLASQRKAKLEMVQSTLLRQAGVEPHFGVVLAGENMPGLHYRKRASFHIDAHGKIGFFERGSGRVVEVSDCLLLEDSLRDEYKRTCAVLRAYGPQLFTGLIVENFNGMTWVLLELRAGAARSQALQALLQALAAEKFSWVMRQGGSVVAACAGERAPPIGHFSQVNEFGNAVLQELVGQFAAGDEVTYLFAGAGNFAFPLAAKGRRIRAVEVDGNLVRVGRLRAQELGLDRHITFFESSCESYLKREVLTPALLMDPPRCGARGIVNQLIESEVQDIVYVSCALPTLCRDLRQLCPSGFELERVFLVDMFAQTHHVETVSVLKRRQV